MARSYVLSGGRLGFATAAASPDSAADRNRRPDVRCRIDAETEVRAANAAFYEAFEARDIDAMSEVWEHSDRVVCTHPGWQALRGWGAVSGSWFALFRGDNPLQFILTNQSVSVEGDVGWVNVDENVIGERIGGTVAALNVFTFDGERWRMVVHHGSPVASTSDE